MSVLVAPLLEEWFFRGTLYRALRQALGERARVMSTTLAVVISAGLFALAHGEPLQFAGLVFLGMVLALLVRTNTTRTDIVAHTSFNGVAFAALLSQRR